MSLAGARHIVQSDAEQEAKAVDARQTEFKVSDEFAVGREKQAVVNRVVRISGCATYVSSDNGPTIRVEKVDVTAECKFENVSPD